MLMLTLTNQHAEIGVLSGYCMEFVTCAQHALSVETIMPIIFMNTSLRQHCYQTVKLN